ncbi:unnamed protein product [Strongylus vulgaris]|uniref:Follistatin-like domain-containing protein n=1 Tax=Strongylus vulgaris TaxID=40348 RepID=A0A3P7K593_STRVU|nr:unnamed protein product [Strongylus vulgaris]
MTHSSSLPDTCPTRPCPPGQLCEQVIVDCIPGVPCPQPPGRCVPNLPDTCPTRPCPPGQRCEQVIVNCIRGAPCPQPPGRCVPNQPSITCDNVRCRDGTTCQLINNRPQCVPNNSATSKIATGATKEPYNPCAATSCPVGSECRVRQVQCIRAPCNPIAECYNPSKSNGCGTNESYRDCASHCEPTCAICIQSCAPGKCQCNQGFYRNASGQCVTANDCDGSAGTNPYRRIR